MKMWLVLYFLMHNGSISEQNRWLILDDLGAVYTSGARAAAYDQCNDLAQRQAMTVYVPRTDPDGHPIYGAVALCEEETIK